MAELPKDDIPVVCSAFLYLMLRWDERTAHSGITKNALNSERRNAMKWYVKKVTMAFLFVTILFVGTLSGVSDVWAKDKGGTLAKQIQGSWTLVSIVNEQDGKKIDLFGPNPRGSLILTPNGRLSLILMRATLPKFASNNREKGTAEENKAIVQGAIAHFGKYEVVNEKEGTINMTIEGCTFPNWDGQVQERIISVKGDELRMTTPKPSVGGTSYLIWKRAK
jgi:hypothetical protein